MSDATAQAAAAENHGWRVTFATAQAAPVENHGWRVTFAGLGINLALGVLYSWSIIAGGADKAGWGWNQTQKNLPYSVACLVFCLIMVPAGRMQDKIGPRIVATIGGVLVGLGMILCSFTTTPAMFVLGFGVLAGAGFGFGYASATPPAVKWFPKAKTGMIAGLVVSGFGLASVYVAPVANALINAHGMKTMIMVLGIGFLFIVCGLAQLLKPPPAGYVPEGEAPAAVDSNGQVKKEEFSPTEMLKTWQFYAVWFMYACGAGAGLMVISVARKIGAAQQVGVVFVVALAVGNGAGRIIAGFVSDKLGRQLTLFIFLVIQAVIVILLSLATSGQGALSTATVLTIMAALVGANYGSNLSLFPSITKDYYGLKNFGVNYGLVFTAWGIGGFLLALLAGAVYDGKIVAAWKGSFSFAFYTSAALLVLAAIMTFVVKAPHHLEDAAEATA
ncbi:OFA family MFS transporter [bacterium]|nr:OFA family MFS transporter [bacterium]